MISPGAEDATPDDSTSTRVSRLRGSRLRGDGGTSENPTGQLTLVTWRPRHVCMCGAFIDASQDPEYSCSSGRGGGGRGGRQLGGAGELARQARSEGVPTGGVADWRSTDYSSAADAELAEQRYLSGARYSSIRCLGSLLLLVVSGDSSPASSELSSPMSSIKVVNAATATLAGMLAGRHAGTGR